MTHHEICNNNEIFVGNIYTAKVDKEIKELTEKNIKFRIGKLAYDIEGKKISPKDCLPLLIYKESYDKYDDKMMEELNAIRRYWDRK